MTNNMKYKQKVNIKQRHQRYILIIKKDHYYISAEEGFVTIIRVNTFKTKVEAEKSAKIFEKAKFNTIIKVKYNE